MVPRDVSPVRAKVAQRGGDGVEPVPASPEIVRDAQSQARLGALVRHLGNIGAELHPTGEAGRPGVDVQAPAQRPDEVAQQVRPNRVGCVQHHVLAAPVLIGYRRQQVIRDRSGRLLELVEQVAAVNAQVASDAVVHARDELFVVLLQARGIEHDPGSRRAYWDKAQDLGRDRIEPGDRNLFARKRS